MKATQRKITSLTDLKTVKKEIDAQTQNTKELAAAQTLQAKRLAAQKNLFQVAAGTVTQLHHPPMANLNPAPPAPIPKQRLLDEAAALREALSDEVDVSRLLDTDEHLSFRRSGVGPDVVQKLRRGEWAVQGQMDLHGLCTDEAREALGSFIREAHKQGLRCVRVITGKGLGSPGKAPVLKDKAHRWLMQKSEVVAFVQAQPAQGGTGALLVLLQPLRR
jgi:DNA-nicking Smr family endonuclease